ncbi:MAG TPA: hypothetical protein VGP53_02760 [Acidimicrobiales bacterium]|nr:hypothetical protein [Acidimicrobiales bacterium]
MPASLRDQLDVIWDGRDEARYQQVQRQARWLFNILPVPLRTSGTKVSGQVLLWQARRHVSAFEATRREAGGRAA